MGILLITHDLHQAELLCAKVGFLLNGTIAQQGRPRALLDQTFAGQGEFIVEFAELLSAEQAVRLQQVGFVADNSGLSWQMVGDRSLGALAADLERAGIRPREMRFRQPGLDSLFLRLLRHPGAPEPEAAA
jgi:ABC-2 type transport system ATP-binding protein